MENKRQIIRNIIVVSIAIIVIDQLLKIYITNSLSTVGENQSIIGDFLVLYHTATNISMVSLGIKLIIGILLSLLARYFLLKNGESRFFLFGLSFLSLGFLARAIDFITIGQIDNVILSGLSLKTIDTLFINLGFYRTFVSFSSVIGFVGLILLIYSLITNFNVIKSTFKK